MLCPNFSARGARGGRCDREAQYGDQQARPGDRHREHIWQTKKASFGLSLPDLNLFGRSDRDVDEISAIDGVIGGARMDENSAWILQLEAGATWRQIDSRPLASAPRRGRRW